MRKLTAILYLNPGWQRSWGGELRIWGNDGVVEDIEPVGDRLVLFWSDMMVHEVLANTSNRDRYALTLWLVAVDEGNINDPLRGQMSDHFP